MPIWAGCDGEPAVVIEQARRYVRMAAAALIHLATLRGRVPSAELCGRATIWLGNQCGSGDK